MEGFNIRWLTKEIQGIKIWEACVVLFSAVLFGFLITNEPELKHSRDTRLVRNEMKRMGYSNEAEDVVLERTSQAGVYRASVSILGEDGVVIEYWRRITSRSHSWASSQVRIVPYFDYNP